MKYKYITLFIFFSECCLWKVWGKFAGADEHGIF